MAAGRPRKKKVRAADEPTDTSPQPRLRSLGTRSGDSGPLRGRFGAACRGSAIVGRARPRICLSAKSSWEAALHTVLKGRAHAHVETSRLPAVSCLLIVHLGSVNLVTDPS